jgi:hypothetical protein
MQEMACLEAPPPAEVLPGDDVTSVWVDTVLAELAGLIRLTDGLNDDRPPTNDDSARELAELRRMCDLVPGLNPMGVPGSYSAWRTKMVALAEMAARNRIGRVENALIAASNKLRALIDAGKADIVIPARMQLTRDPMWPGLALVHPEHDPRLAEAIPPQARLGGLNAGGSPLYACVGFAGHGSQAPEPPRPCTVKEVVLMTRAVNKERHRGMWAADFLEAARAGYYESTPA